MQSIINNYIQPILYKINILETNAFINKLNETFAPIQLPFLRQTPYKYGFRGLPDIHNFQGQYLREIIHENVSNPKTCDKLLSWVINHKKEMRLNWIQELINNKELQLHKDFDENTRAYTIIYSDKKRNIKEWFDYQIYTKQVSAWNLMRDVFQWNRTKQGFTAWEMVNLCYVIGVPLNVTNDIYVKLCNAENKID